MKAVLVLVISLQISLTCYCQKVDSIVNEHPRSLKHAVAFPVILTFASLATLTDNEVIDKYEVHEARQRYLPKFRTHADDFLQYAPIAAIYGLDNLGVKGKNDVKNQTALIVKTEIVMSVLTFSLKKITAVPRPDTGQPTSFPSGHTAQAFAAATMLSKEYGHKSPWVSIGAYSVATGVGALRVLNNRHWISDVLAGAGVGILSANLVYLTHRHHTGKKKMHGSTLVLPAFDGKTGMVSLVHSFR